MAIRHFSPTDLAARWNVSPRTLERWRWTGEGPTFLKLGRRVVYRLEDIEAHEEQSRQDALARMAENRALTEVAAGVAQ
jgi:helix-turn-helix protein